MITPPADVEPRSQSALRVDVDEHKPASARVGADETDGTTNSTASTIGYGSSISTAARTANAAVDRAASIGPPSIGPP